METIRICCVALAVVGLFLSSVGAIAGSDWLGNSSGARDGSAWVGSPTTGASRTRENTTHTTGNHFYCTFSPRLRATEGVFSALGTGRVPPCPAGADRSDSQGTGFFSSYFSGDRRVALLKLIRSTGVREDRILVMEKPGFQNAAAAQCAMPDGEIKQLIMWDPQFMEELDNRTGTNWASVAVLGHEIAHHANNDTGQGQLPAHKRREQELYADRWAGQRLRSFGASREEAIAVFRQMGEGGSTHPPWRQRVAAAGEGWDRAGEVEPGPQRVPRPTPVPAPSPRRYVQYCLDQFGNAVCVAPTNPPGSLCECYGIGYGLTSVLIPVQ